MTPQFTTAQRLLASHAAKTSQATFVYESTTRNSFGEELVGGKHSKVWKMETRPGAGASLAGYLNTLTAPSTSQTPLSPAPVTALLNPTTLTSMVPSLLSLSIPSPPRPNYTLQVSLATEIPGQPLSEDLSAVIDAAAAFDAFEDDSKTAVVFSRDPKDVVALGVGLSGALNRAGFDFVHAFDGVDAGREMRVFEPVGAEASEAVAASADGALDLETAVVQALAAIHEHHAATSPKFFTYHGPSTATQVFILPTSASSANAIEALRIRTSPDAQVGILEINVLRPWSTAQLLAALPSTTEIVHVYGEQGREALLEVVLGSLSQAKKIRGVVLGLPAGGPALTPSAWKSVIDDAVAIVATPPYTPAPGTGFSSPSPRSIPVPEIAPRTTPASADGTKRCIFWGADESVVAVHLAESFAKDTGVATSLRTAYDNYSQFGLQRSSLLLSTPTSTTASHAGSPDLVVIENPTAVFAAYAPLAVENLSANTQVVVASPGWTPEEYEVKLDVETKRGLWEVYGAQSEASRTGGVWSVDVKKVADAFNGSVDSGKIVEAAVWIRYFGAREDLPALLKATDAFSGVEDLAGLVDAVGANTAHVRIPEEWEHVVEEGESNAIEAAKAGAAAAAGAEAKESVFKPATILGNSAGPNPHKAFPDPIAATAAWTDAAKALMFSEAYGTAVDARRPDLLEDNFVLEVTENRRLTPLDYDRNVFHLELSTKGTGMKYAVGEALGVHGWNDADEVNEFLEWYGLDPSALVSVPHRSDVHGAKEQRTVFQAFQQNLDIFGKPPKSFYEELSKVATEKAERDHLHFIASAEGSSTFKKWSESDTATYADVFKAFPSARFTVAELATQIELIKPRHYSIASSQNFVGDSVHLLVVTVDWQTPTGTQRFGQCTRYLAGLRKGTKVMVSVKPSVMKLPPIDTQPIIMAGLGTGAAPFRAFIQERAWQRAQGKEVGPLLYYFGSRYRSKEYLYGEELEAYMRDGVVTHAGLAFSRDGTEKVYIQHKMMQDATTIADLLHDGVFYLCGPTWPVPDVYEALCHALGSKGIERQAAEKYLEEMKEDERYVLEVY